MKSWAVPPPAAPKMTSATPPPSEPGSQAATKASDALISGFVHSGRPDRKIVTTGMPAAWSRPISSTSDLSPGLNSRLDTSPWLSA